MTKRFAVQAIGLSAGLFLCLPTTPDAAESSSLAAIRGKAILQEKCGRCHAIEVIGESPLKNAPPMRDIYTRFNPRALEEGLSEGIGSVHKEMPQIQFSDEDVYAILSYLYALAVRK
jgi:mono/diheme cytochrome c family protein